MNKQIKTKIILCSLVLGISSVLFSCAGTESLQSSEKEASSEKIINTETVEYPVTQENVRALGRSYFMDDSLWMTYSSTGAEFSINAKRLDISLIGDSGARAGNTDSAARIVVFVNGERKLDEMLLSQKAVYTVFDQKETVSGIVRILKVSEVANSTAGLKSIILDKDGTFSPTSPKNLKIEFIGDSITCGYGVDDLNKDHHFKTSTEDNSKTYAYKTAETLDADYSMVSISGWGIISGYTSNGTQNTSSLLPEYYDKLGFSWGTYEGYKPQQLDWDFSKFTPDIIVINLGTNDASYTKGQSDRIEEYKTAYIDFLKQIREKNPEAQIICSLGIMGQDLYPAIEELVKDYKDQTADAKVSTLKYNQWNAADGIGADWHPSEKTHAKAAVTLTKVIKDLGY